MPTDPSRRTVAALALAATAAPVTAQPAATPGLATPNAGTGGAATPAAPARRPRVAALVHDDMVMLDLAGPLTVFNLMGAETVLVARDRRPVRTELGLPVTPAASFADAPFSGASGAPDILFVPGGLRGTVDAMRDAATRNWLRAAGAGAGHVTAVCTGGLLLGAAGLLRGHRATAHWYVRDLLALFGAEPVEARVVADRNRLTGGGVTAGLDFGLSLAALIRGEAAARRIQLVIEYDPRPPFDAGTPATAGPALTAEVLRARAPILAEARAAAEALRA